MCANCSFFFNAFFSLVIMSAALLIAVNKSNCTFTMNDMTGKVVVVTGANSGIGFWSAKMLADMNAEVIIGCRTLQKAKEAKERMEKESGRSIKIVPLEVDLSSLKSVLEFTREVKSRYEKLDVLINNAAVMRIFSKEDYTKDGLEMMMGVNHISHHLLTRELIELIRRGGKGSRVINLTAVGHKLVSTNFVENLMGHNVSGIVQYCNSKAANILFSLELQKRVGACIFSLHPGNIETHINRDMPHWLFPFFRVIQKLFLLSPKEGALSTIFLASDPSLQNSCGKYWEGCSMSDEAPVVRDQELAKKLWDKTEEILRSKLKF